MRYGKIVNNRCKTPCDYNKNIMIGSFECKLCSLFMRKEKVREHLETVYVEVFCEEQKN
jgi:hypothetical protein